MIRCHIDIPARDEVCDPLCFSVEGWIQGDGPEEVVERLEVHGGGALLGQTRTLFVRGDVNDVLKLPAASRTGFRVFCQWIEPPSSGAEFEVRAVLHGGEVRVVATNLIAFSIFDHRKLPFGKILDADFLPLLHREHVYTSGPSLAEGSTEVIELLKAHLPPPPARILDVGCGLGYYGRALRNAGYDWFGVEMKEEDCRALAAAGLPHRQVDGKSLPFESNSFDAVICLEVLEHVPDPHAFLRENARVAPRLIVSVPNFELVPYLYRYSAVPWHMLEADHRNFFTRWSLSHLLEQHYNEVEVGCYRPLELRSPEGATLYYHLLASARARTP